MIIINIIIKNDDDNDDNDNIRCFRSQCLESYEKLHFMYYSLFRIPVYNISLVIQLASSGKRQQEIKANMDRILLLLRNVLAQAVRSNLGINRDNLDN